MVDCSMPFPFLYIVSNQKRRDLNNVCMSKYMKIAHMTVITRCEVIHSFSFMVWQLFLAIEEKDGREGRGKEGR